MIDGGRSDNERLLGDYMTPEYASMNGIPEFYWETTRGLVDLLL